VKIVMAGRELETDPGFAADIRRRTGENVFLCYQCRKCSSGCPVRAWMNGGPTELMRFAQLGLARECLESDAIWYCASCFTCSTRCPAGIDIAHVVDAMRIVAVERRARARGRTMRLFNRLWMTMLPFSGRMYELGLVGLLNGLGGNPFKDAGLGIRMILKRKMSLLPRPARTFEMMRIFRRARRKERS